jgi:hypothetical protein
MDDYLVGKTMDKPQNFAGGGDVVAEDTVTIGQDFTPSKNMAEAQAKLDTGVKDLRADRKVQFDKMTEQLTSGAVKDMELEEQENFVALYKLLKQHHNFAEGGAVPMKEQMSMFDDGGLMDEGGSVDPVSGNDVPPGSTQEEVRDDIPAQLSEGEFVFPADVVRFIGLSNLMSMRQEAKMGLKQMEAMGQMGNSDEATMPDDLPFDINDLDVEDDGEYNDTQEFAVGGMPTSDTGVYFSPATGPTTGVAPTPTQAASQQFVQPVRPTQANVPTTPTYTAAEIPSFASSVGQNIPGVDFEYVEYTNEAGNVIKLRKSKSTGQMLDAVPEGYTFVDPATTPTVSPTAQVKPAVPYDEGQGSRDAASNIGPPAGITSTNAKAAALKALDPKFGNVIKDINDKYSNKVTNINPLLPGGLIRTAINGFKKMSETKKAINDYDYTTLGTPTNQQIADGKGNSLTADEMKNVVNTIGSEIYSGYRDKEGNITAESMAKGPKSTDGLVQQMKDGFSKVTGIGGQVYDEDDYESGTVVSDVPTVSQPSQPSLADSGLDYSDPVAQPITDITKTAITDIANKNQSDMDKEAGSRVTTAQVRDAETGKIVSDVTNIAEIISSAAEQVAANRTTQQAVEILLNNSITTDADGVSKTTLSPEDALTMVKQFGADELIEDDKAVKAAELARKAKQEQDRQDESDRAVKATQQRYFEQQGGEGNVTQPTLADSGLDYGNTQVGPTGGGSSDENPGGGSPSGGSTTSSSDGFDDGGAFSGMAQGGLASKPKPKKTKKMKKGGLASKK